MSSNPFSVQIYPFNTSEKKLLADKWQTLEGKADNSFFLSWLWIGSWLDLVEGKIFVVECYQKDTLVGLGLFVEKTRKVFGVFPIKQWFLHKTGNEKQDQIWIEHNDFLLDSSVADEVRRNMVSAVSQYDESIKEVVVGLSSDEVTACFKIYFGNYRDEISTKGYFVDLSEIKGRYLDTIPSKNTRAQIKRSDKLLSQQGDLNFTVITNKDEVKALFIEIAKLHIKRWENTHEGSGFTNFLFNDFHQKLIGDSAESTVQVSVLSVGEKALGYLINFVYNQKVYFYLSALTTSNNSKLKIGLSLHSQAIQYYMDMNIKCYDFLGGDARYKQSLSNMSYQLTMTCFFKNNKVLWFENSLKYLKGFFSR